MKAKWTAAIAMVAGLAMASAHAGEASNVLIGQPTFEERCQTGGGAIDSGEAIALCDLGDLVVKCDFEGAYASCGWRGTHSRRLTALLGALPAESLSERSGGGTFNLSPWASPNWISK